MWHIIVQNAGLIINAALMAAAPILMAALGSCFSERSGVINIALDGIMVMGGFTGAAVACFCEGGWPGFLAGGIAGALTGLLFAVVCVVFRADQTVAGMAFNFICPGIATVLCSFMFDGEVNTPSLDVGRKLPRMFEGRFEPGTFGYSVLEVCVLTYAVYVIAILCHFVFERTAFGLHLRACGEHPEACEAAGIDVYAVRFVCVVLSSFMTGLGGAFITLSTVSMYRHEFIAGQGYIALAAVVFGKYSPGRTTIACLIFGICIGLKSVLGSANIISPHLVSMLPYVVTVLVLVLFSGRPFVPAANGKIYRK